MLSEAGLLADAGDAGGGEGAAEPAEGLQGAAVGGNVEVHLPVLLRGFVFGFAGAGEEAVEAAAGVLGLAAAFGGEADKRVGDATVGALVHVPLALPVPHQHDAPRTRRRGWRMRRPELREVHLLLRLGAGRAAAARDAERVLAAAAPHPGRRARTGMLHGRRRDAAPGHRRRRHLLVIGEWLLYSWIARLR